MRINYLIFLIPICLLRFFAACGRDLTDAVGLIESPNYPDKYANNRVCVWRIVMETGKQILLNVTDFAMEAHSPVCRNDYLEIRSV